MNRIIPVLIIVIMITAVMLSSCGQKNKETLDLTLSQNDIDLLAAHKKQLDRITEKFDRELQKSKGTEKVQIVEKGKKEINSYLESKDINPLVFMRKSKKILKGYLAFLETGPEALERKIRLLQSQELTEKQHKQAIEAYKKSNEDLFREYTSELSDYEIELIRMNIGKLSDIIKNSAVNTITPEKKTGPKTERK